MSYRIAIAAALACIAASSAAAGQGCLGAIAASSQVHHALTTAHEGATPAAIKRSYARAFAAARDEAIAAWRAKVRMQCPTASALWRRAVARSVTECDRAMGGRFTVCARALPAPR
jgi:hypothetical protein